MSTDKTSWERVIKESECKNVKVSQANDTWQVSKTLPRRFVVPSPVSDVFLTRVGGLFRDNRPPVWIWGNKSYHQSLILILMYRSQVWRFSVCTATVINRRC